MLTDRTYDDLHNAEPAALAKSKELVLGDIQVVFQPVVDLDTGDVFAQEALVRSNHPDHHSPLQLFAHAVRQRSCGRLGRTIRSLALSRGGCDRMFVNIHPRELTSRCIIEADDPLYSYPGELYIELTEHAAFDDRNPCREVLQEIRRKSGARLAVDDFGAGYSNLMRVLELEPEIVKLDLTLVRGLHRDPRRQTLVRHMVSLCEDLGSRVVIEGIEHVDELKAAIDAGVHYGQGYLLAEPAAPPSTVHWPIAKLVNVSG